MPLPWSSKSDKGKNRRVAGSDEPHSSESTEAALSSSSSSSSTAAEKKSSLGQPPPFEDPASYSYDYSHHVKASAINHPNAPTSASSSSLSPNPPSSIRHSWDGTSSKQTQSTNLYAAPGAPVNATYIYTGPGGTVVSNGPIPSSSEPNRKESKTIRTINRMERRLQQSIAQAEQAILGPPAPSCVHRHAVPGCADCATAATVRAASSSGLWAATPARQEQH
ncbi:hypothetical protein DFJ73DRAFT_152587 [Zopfochytrium polystomum]|nr:hypothetical protein DFJ73DRAFT_152587 [Zopfochytrium polystomum]